MSYRLATPEEESKGIDGYVGDTAYSVKPVSYKNMTHLQEKIPVKMVYYVKTSDGLEIEIEEDPYYFSIFISLVKLESNYISLSPFEMHRSMC